MKRLAFYTFWEKNGIVRKYVLTYLKGLQESKLGWKNT